MDFAKRAYPTQTDLALHTGSCLSSYSARLKRPITCGSIRTQNKDLLRSRISLVVAGINKTDCTESDI